MRSEICHGGKGVADGRKITEKLQERREVCNLWQSCFQTLECRTLQNGGNDGI